MSILDLVAIADIGISPSISPSITVEARTADLTVVGGAGHVGIPLVLSFAAQGLTVNVNDLNRDNLGAL